MASGEVISSIFLARNELFGMEELAIATGPNFIDDSRFEIDKDSPWDMLSWSSLTEEGVESIVSATKSGVTASTSTIKLMHQYLQMQSLKERILMLLETC